MSIHWHAPAPPATTSTDLRIEALPLPSPWNAAFLGLRRLPFKRGANKPACPKGEKMSLSAHLIPIARPKVQLAQLQVDRADRAGKV